mmetsp:Transcript_17079/g.33429  ORF Transcript_17079/g.33429 Transcript_17079/m.33429 type:complete len:380 (-) Transcript_17079:131-1270(-)
MSTIIDAGEMASPKGEIEAGQAEQPSVEGGQPATDHASVPDDAERKNDVVPVKHAPTQQAHPAPTQPRPKRRNRRTSISAECVDPADDASFELNIIEKTPEERERIERSVEDNFLFATLDNDQRNQVLGAMIEKRASKNKVIIEQGSAGDFFYVLDSGTADVFVNETKVLSYSGGSSFGELALMYNCPRAATVKATSDCVLWALDRQTFRHILSVNQSAKRSKYEDFLKSCPLFENLAEQEIYRIADVLVDQYFDPESVIITEGDDNQSEMKFYMVISGEVEAFKGDDRSTVVGRSGPGEFFGEKALIESAPRAATVIAKTPVQCAYLDIAAFERLLGPCKDIMRRQIDLYRVNTDTPAAGSAINAARALTPPTSEDQD